MTHAPPLEALLGLSLRDALDRGGPTLSDALILPAVPPRPRHPYPPEADWRVVRVRVTAGRPELVIVPPIAMPTEAVSEAGAPC